MTTPGGSALAIIQAFKDDDEMVRTEALLSLRGGTMSDVCIVALAEALADRRSRPAAVTHLSGKGAAPAIPTLLRYLEADDPQLRRCGALALGQIGRAAKPALPALRRHVDDPDEACRKAVKDALILIDFDP